MKTNEIVPERPDGILLVIAYFLVLAIGFLLGGLILLFTALPGALGMARGDSFFLAGAAVLVLLITVCLLLGATLLYTALQLWRSAANGRALAAVLAAVIAALAALSIPAFFVAYDWGSNLFLVTVAIALLLAISGAAAFWYLTRPHVKRYLG